MNFSPESNIKPMPLTEYLLSGIITPRIYWDKGYGVIHNQYFSPDSTIERVESQIQECPQFKEKFDQWKDQIEPSKTNNIIDKRTWIKLLLIDIGVLKIDQNPEEEQARDKPAWANSVIHLSPRLEPVLNTIFPNVARAT